MKEKMHIAFFTNTYYPTMSGVVRSVSTFRQILTDLGHNVFIFAQYAKDYEDDEPFIFRYPAIEVPLSNKYAFPIPVSYTINEVLPILKLDVVHSHHPFLLGEVAAKKAEELDLPLVFTFHTRYDEYSHYIPFNQKLAKRAIVEWLGRYLERCQHIVTPSESIRQMLLEVGVSGKITAIPTGIDVEPFVQADREKIRRQKQWGDDTVLITIGRLAKEKNYDTLLQAVATVMSSRDQVRLVIIGDGPEADEIKQQAEELGIAKKVEFTGRVPYDEVPNYLKAADIFCFASVTETQGLVTMEAMAASLPVVAVEAPGTSDAVEHDKQGLLTENDSQALAEAIARVIDDDDLRQKFKEGAEQRIEWFDIKVQGNKLLEVYGEAIEDKQADRSVQVDLNLSDGLVGS